MPSPQRATWPALSSTITAPTDAAVEEVVDEDPPDMIPELFEEEDDEPELPEPSHFASSTVTACAAYRPSDENRVLQSHDLCQG